MRLNKLLSRLVDHWPAKILSIAAAVVIYVFHQINTLEQRYVTVPLQLFVNPSLVVVSDHPVSVRVLLKGQEEIFNILDEEIEAYADFSTYDSEGVYKSPIRINRSGTAADVESLEVTVDPVEITVVLEPRVTRSLAIEAVVRGEAAYGYEITSSSMTPSVVEAEGPRSAFSGLAAIETEPIDLSGRQADFTLRVRLAQPHPLISFPGGGTVEYSARLVAVVGERTIDAVPVVPVGLAAGLAVSTTLEPGSVVVTGQQAELAGLGAERFRLVFDCSAIQQPGLYVLPLRAETLPEDGDGETAGGAAETWTLASFAPMEAAVTIVRGETP